jgi:hypothetical protein
MTSQTHAELQYGVAKNKHKDTNQNALDEFLLPLTILPFHGKRLVACYGEIMNFRESRISNVKIGCPNFSGLREKLGKTGVTWIAIDSQIINYTSPEEGRRIRYASTTDNAVKIFIRKTIELLSIPPDKGMIQNSRSIDSRFLGMQIIDPRCKNRNY